MASAQALTVRDKEVQAGLTLNEVVCVVDNVCAEEYGSQQREDGVLDWSWREEHLEQAPDQKRHEAAEKHWAQEAANTEIVSQQHNTSPRLCVNDINRRSKQRG